MRNVHKILIVCVLFFGSTVCQEEDIICPPRNYEPIKVTSPYMYPYTVLIVRVEPKPIEPDGVAGTIISPYWVLTRASTIMGRLHVVKEWGIAGPNTNEVRLDKTMIYPVEAIRIHPFFNGTNQRSPYNFLILKMKYTDDNIIPVAFMGQNNIDRITELNAVYWMLQDIFYYRKFTTYFCPHLRAMRSKCYYYNREPHLCLAGSPEGNLDPTASPCGADCKSLGTGIFTENQLLAIYMGVDDRDLVACQKPPVGTRFFHGALRVQLEYDPGSPEIQKLISWINGTQDDYYSTTTRRTTTRARVKPSSLWQFCVSGAHVSNPLVLILILALVVSALLV